MAAKPSFNDKTGVSRAVINRFMEAVAADDMAAVQRAVEKHPDAVTWRDNTRSTALHHAARGGHVDIAAFLLDHGADVNARNVDASQWDSVTPLIVASEWEKNLAMVNLLIARGADLNAATGLGETALMRAAKHAMYDVNQGQGDKVLRALVAAGADETLKNSSGQAVLDIVGTPEAAAAIREAAAQRDAAKLQKAQQEHAREQAGIENAVAGGIATPAVILSPIKLKPRTPPA